MFTDQTDIACTKHRVGGIGTCPYADFDLIRLACVCEDGLGAIFQPDDQTGKSVLQKTKPSLKGLTVSYRLTPQ